MRDAAPVFFQDGRQDCRVNVLDVRFRVKDLGRRCRVCGAVSGNPDARAYSRSLTDALNSEQPTS